MTYKGTIGKTNWVLGELSPRVLGRFDADKPIHKNGAAILENMMIAQSGGVMFRPGTKYVAEVKNSANEVRLERFQYSLSQEYVLEIGDLYMRFFTNGGQLTVADVPVEIVTIFAQASIFDLQMANKADVMYIVHPSYKPQKLIRTSATTFTISDVPFVRGPFLDDNLTATTITPSSDTGATTLTASTPIFLLGHVGSYWRVKGGVVKITGFTSTTVLTGTVQLEPSGVAGNLGTGPGAVTDWAEGAFSAVRGYPTAVAFHEQRLVYAGTLNAPQTLYASASGAYDNFYKGIGRDSDAWIYEIASNIVNSIRWLNSDTALKIGTSGGTVTAASQGTAGITPTAPPLITFDTDDGVMQTPSIKMGGYVFYIQANKFNLRQLTFDLIVNKDKTNDLNLLADHILRDGDGAVQMARQQSPSDRIWIVRSDGQIAVVTINSEQKVIGWFRIIGGESDFTVTCDGLAGHFESITVLPQDGADDQVWAVCQRRIGGTFKRFVEYFTDELFQEYWEPVRVDASLSYNNPIEIDSISNTNPAVVTTTSAHGFTTGNLVKINAVVGMSGEVNDKVYEIRNVTATTFELWLV